MSEGFVLFCVFCFVCSAVVTVTVNAYNLILLFIPDKSWLQYMLMLMHHPPAVKCFEQQMQKLCNQWLDYFLCDLSWKKEMANMCLSENV